MDMSAMTSTSSSAMPTSTMDMSSMESSSSSSSSMMMQMTFTTQFLHTPVLFSGLAPTTSAEAFGIWLLIFSVAILYRGLVFARTYLEAAVWAPGAAQGFKEADGVPQAHRLRQPFSPQRDAGRLLLTFATAMLAYALMLVTMSFVVAWFFAVVTGLAVGELIFARLTAGSVVAVGHH